jgi:hypothetical protein
LFGFVLRFCGFKHRPERERERERERETLL